MGLLYLPGLFVSKDTHEDSLHGIGGLFKGGGWYLLGIQVLTVVSVSVWTIVTTAISLKVNAFTVLLIL